MTKDELERQRHFLEVCAVVAYKRRDLGLIAWFTRRDRNFQFWAEAIGTDPDALSERVLRLLAD